jgi:transcriptional regulator with XRE-family HTH domain
MRLTATEYGRRIGISEGSIRNKLNGRTEFTRVEMLATSKLTGKSMDYLFAKEEGAAGTTGAALTEERGANEGERA